MVGKSGVAGHGFDSVGGLQAILHELGDVKLLQERLDRLAKVKTDADKAKREAKRTARAAENEAKAKAEEIIKEAEEQAQDRLGAVQDLEARLAADRTAWEAERNSERSKLRSDRSKAGAATKAANDEKQKAAKAREAYEAAGRVVEDTRAALDKKYLAMQEIWRG